MRRSFLIILLILAVVVYVNIPLLTSETPTFKKAEVPEVFVGEPITPNEINSFLEVWPDYVNSWVSHFGVSQLSLTNSDNIKKKTPYITIIWLNRRGWEVDRFFYVEQRLKSIVRSAQAEEHVRETIFLLEKKLQQETDGSARQNVEAMMKYHQKSLNVEKVSQAEIKMVQPRLSEISEILELKEK
ncbi:MAG: hypothetical protein ACK5N8_08250 [Alphaproteobacteria bacterium]